MVSVVSPMATNIQTTEDLEQLQQINGVPLATIEGRSEVANFYLQGKHIKECITEDWNTVEKMGYTHIKIAEHLKSIWRALTLPFAEQKGNKFLLCYNESSPYSTAKVEVLGQLNTDEVASTYEGKKEFSYFDYGMAFLAKVHYFALPCLIGTVSAIVIPIPIVSVVIVVALSILQTMHTLKENVFLEVELKTNQNPHPDLFDGFHSNRQRLQNFNAEMIRKVNREIKIKNLQTKEEINVTEFMIRYIRDYGFYGGGNQNEYRIPPAKLVSIISNQKKVMQQQQQNS